MQPLPVAGGSPLAITAGPDGNLWFCEIGGNKIGRITTGGTITEFPLPHPKSFPAYITAGPDGNVWFTEQGPNALGRIGRITPAGVITEYNVSFELITVGPDGNLWYTDEDNGTASTGTQQPHTVRKFVW